MRAVHWAANLVVQSATHLAAKTAATTAAQMVEHSAGNSVVLRADSRAARLGQTSVVWLAAEWAGQTDEWRAA